jgi:hypothetical protein
MNYKEILYIFFPLVCVLRVYYPLCISLYNTHLQVYAQKTTNNSLCVIIFLQEYHFLRSYTHIVFANIPAM